MKPRTELDVCIDADAYDAYAAGNEDVLWDIIPEGDWYDVGDMGLDLFALMTDSPKPDSHSPVGNLLLAVSEAAWTSAFVAMARALGVSKDNLEAVASYYTWQQGVGNETPSDIVIPRDTLFEVLGMPDVMAVHEATADAVER